MFFTMIGGGVALALLSVIFITLFALRRVVPTNMVHIVQSGKKTVSYGKDQAAGNVYYEIPSFIPIWGVLVSKFEVSNFRVALDNYAAYDSGRLPFVVDVVAFFNIFDSDMAAKRVSSFQELHAQLQEILRGSVRSVLAEHKLEDILGIRAELGQTFTQKVDEQLKQWGVRTVKTIEFMDMRDSNNSTVIHDIMAKDQARISMESRIAIADNNRMAEEREIAAKRDILVKKQEADLLVGQKTAETEKAVGIAKEKAIQEVQAEAKTTTERQMEVVKVQEVKQAEIARDVQVVNADAARKVEVTKAEAEKQTLVIKAEGLKTSQITESQGQLEATINEATGVEKLGAAKAAAEAALLLAPVTAQTTLAKEIGSNDGYQKYLIEIRRVEATENVGKEMAGAMKTAEMKIIANAGDVQGGLGRLADVFTPAGGTSIAGMLEALAQTPQGQAVVEKLTGPQQPKNKSK